MNAGSSTRALAGPPLLSVASWLERSVVNGPGERFVLWLQGCPFRCPGCFNPDFLPFEGGRPMSVAEVASLVEGVAGIEGVTFSGGEPMAQAEGLATLAAILKARGLTLACYSGYTLEELRAAGDPSVLALLDLLDILIDGRYEAAQRATLPWRGSRNQRVHFLSPAYRHLASTVDRAHAEVEIIIGAEGLVRTGMIAAVPALRLASFSGGPPS
jgi:anaerobic ribonucleoside-triphosphate reductase activating protein